MKTSTFMSQLYTMFDILLLFTYQKAIFSPENLNSDGNFRENSSNSRIELNFQVQPIEQKYL